MLGTAIRDPVVGQHAPDLSEQGDGFVGIKMFEGVRRIDEPTALVGEGKSISQVVPEVELAENVAVDVDHPVDVVEPAAQVHVVTFGPFWSTKPIASHREPGAGEREIPDRLIVYILDALADHGGFPP